MDVITLRSDGFGFEPEITIKLGRRGARVYEVPVSYHGRTYEEGKKIGLRDALRALGHTLSSTPEIGAATAIRLLPDGTFEAAAETSRRGGGSAMVVDPG